MLLGIPFEKLTGGPLDGEKVHSRSGFSDLQGLHHVRVFHPLTVASLPDEACDCRLVLAKLLAKDFDGNDTMCGMVGAEDGGGSSLSDFGP